jgi:hypothetical protein
MSDLSDDLNDKIREELAKPASTSIGGNSTTRRALTELQQVSEAQQASEAAQQPNMGIRRKRFRHRGPGGGP